MPSLFFLEAKSTNDVMSSTNTTLDNTPLYTCVLVQLLFFFESNERTSLSSFAFFLSVDRHLQHLEWIVIAIYIKDLKAWSVAHRPISKQIARLNTL